MEIVKNIKEGLEIISKNSWAVAVVACVVLFFPQELLSKMGLLEIRNNYKGIGWLVLIFSTALWIGSVVSYLFNKISKSMGNRRELKEKIEQQKAAEEIEAQKREEGKRKEKEEKRSRLRLRLDSLDHAEKMWIKYCLYYNVQTLSANMTDSTAQSLVNKGILVQGSGHMMNLPFHVRDDVWAYLKEHEKEYLTDQERLDPNFEKVLKVFREDRFPGIV
ncbi:MAG: super-infection exclusion protein B [Candidatus Subteraquimicrobiales bacterium]|nr:super-infection exclusion protein B [Candidatus Subteraquimicrobiales bacterium]